MYTRGWFIYLWLPRRWHLKTRFSLTTTECNLHVQPLYSSQSFLFIVSLYTWHSPSFGLSLVSSLILLVRLTNDCFAFPWSLMPRPGRETESREAGGKPVAWGYQKGRIDVCWLGPEEILAGGTDGGVVTSVTIKLGPARKKEKASSPSATISTVLSMLTFSMWAEGCHSLHTADRHPKRIVLLSWVGLLIKIEDNKTNRWWDVLNLKCWRKCMNGALLLWWFCQSGPYLGQ